MDRAALGTAWTRYKQGTLWHGPGGKCKGFADANPGEAAKLDAYVAAIVSGQNPTMPALATATGQGLAGMIAAGMSASPPPPPPVIHVAITGTATVGKTLTAVVS